MKFSESWLKTFVAPPLATEALAQLLTMAGLEVEEMARVAPPFSGIHSARILSAEKHPDANRLQVCQVDVGAGAPTQIVCGAPNARAGIIVPCAMPGASLPNGMTIDIANMRGVISDGMLCSAKELGISDEDSGLLELAPETPVGIDLRTALDLDDTIFTLKLTPNRADCLSLIGIAREVAALTGVPAQLPSTPPSAILSTCSRAVTLDAPDACPHYTGRVIEGVDACAPTPEWMRRRLERSGLRPISALVDVTNYVLLEMGQPLHAFDNTYLKGAIHVRMARPGETLTLLNKQTITLSGDILVIADDEKTRAMAGIMGGEDSGITLETRDVFLESAFFAPDAIAGRARRYNFSSDASHRYERGVDWNLQVTALERATALILEICGGKAGPVTRTAAATLTAAKPVRLRLARLDRMLGVPFTAQQVTTFLSRLSFPFTQEGDTFLVTPPSYRFDIAIENDLIEEITRLHGYDNIPAHPPVGQIAMLKAPESRRAALAIKLELAARGFQEVINFAFVPETWEADFTANANPIRLANPIASHLAVMRSSLVGGLVENLVQNLKRKQTRVRIFEEGRCFLRQVGTIAQPWRLAALIYGQAAPETWDADARKADFFDLKSEVLALFAPTEAAQITFIPTTHPALHPGRAARILLADREIGHLGELHPGWAQKYALPTAPTLFEIDRDALTGMALPTYREVPRFQIATRDLAILVDQSLAWQDVLTGLQQAAPALVRDIQLFDLYQGKGVPAGKKSLAFRVVMQDTERTLSDAGMDVAIAKITTWLEQHCQAVLRA